MVPSTRIEALATQDERIAYIRMRVCSLELRFLLCKMRKLLI